MVVVVLDGGRAFRDIVFGRNPQLFNYAQMKKTKKKKKHETIKSIHFSTDKEHFLKITRKNPLTKIKKIVKKFFANIVNWFDFSFRLSNSFSN